MHPVLFKIGPITIYTYGVFVFLGVISVYWLSLREAQGSKIDKEKFSNLFFWTVISGFIGARLLYVLLEWRWFIKHPFEVIFSSSGFVFYGGIIGGVIAFCIFVRKYGWSLKKIADIVGVYIPCGHAIGRLGCFYYGCCYGKPTNSWIGILFPPESPAGMLREKVIPTQLISSFFLLLIFIFLIILKKYKKFDGQIILSYFILYGIFRFIIEFFRGDPRGFIGIFSLSQWLSIIIIAIAFCLWVKSYKIAQRKFLL